MKKLILILLLGPLLSFAQANTAQQKPDEGYCVIYAEPRSFSSNKFNFSVDFGLDPKDTTQVMTREQINESGAIDKIRSVPQVLNYMVAEGWEFVSSYVVNFDRSYTINFVLRRKR